jgi:Cdc6-like AAA superfamily ATPase
MNSVTNPYSPGAGSPPPELAGRDALRAQLQISLARIRLGKPAKSIVMVGLRGVGKTVLLDQIRKDAEASGIYAVRIEAPENKSLPALLAPQLRQTLLRLSRVESALHNAKRALRALAGFAKGLKVSYKDIEVGIDYEPEPGLADNGDLDVDLTALL